MSMNRPGSRFSNSGRWAKSPHGWETSLRPTATMTTESLRRRTRAEVAAPDDEGHDEHDEDPDTEILKRERSALVAPVFAPSLAQLGPFPRRCRIDKVLQTTLLNAGEIRSARSIRRTVQGPRERTTPDRRGGRTRWPRPRRGQQQPGVRCASGCSGLQSAVHHDQGDSSHANDRNDQQDLRRDKELQHNQQSKHHADQHGSAFLTEELIQQSRINGGYERRSEVEPPLGKADQRMNGQNP